MRAPIRAPSAMAAATSSAVPTPAEIRPSLSRAPISKTKP